MQDDSDNSRARWTVNAELNVSGKRLRLEMSVPDAPTPPTRMLPLFRSVADAFVAAAVESAGEKGLEVSCGKGCAACCRQPVMVSGVEARRLREVIDEMPEARRAEVLARFEAAQRLLAESGLQQRLWRMAEAEVIREDELVAVALDYLGLRVACPFLEDELCSIYAERPVSCREYLVTTPAEHCASPTAETVRPVDLGAKVGKILARMGSRPGPRPLTWVPLIYAPQWAEAHPDDEASSPATEQLREFFGHLTGRDIPKS